MTEANGHRKPLLRPEDSRPVTRRVRWASMWFLGAALLFLVSAMLPAVPAAALVMFGGGVGMLVAGVVSLVSAFRARTRLRRALQDRA